MACVKLALSAFVALRVAAAPVVADAEHSGQVARVGVLWPGSAATLATRMGPYRQALQDQGLVERRDVVFELRHADERTERLPGLAAELVRLNVDVISAFGSNGIRIVQQVTSKIPIVGISDDFLSEGLVRSLARPGSNTTGVSILSSELNVKRLSLLKELLPDISRVAVLWDPATGTSQLRDIEVAAKKLTLLLQVFEVRNPDDLSIAFRRAGEQRAEALNVLASPLIASLQKTIVGFAARSRLPAIYHLSGHARAGGLVSYGPNILTVWGQVGALVARVLKGANPSDLPIEQPSKFDLAVNLKTAKALGITIPQSILVRADEVIE